MSRHEFYRGAERMLNDLRRRVTCIDGGCKKCAICVEGKKILKQIDKEVNQ